MGVMKSKERLLELRKKGFRITKVREAFFAIFEDVKKPLSVQEVMEALKKEKIAANKTTIYREIDFFVKQGLLRSVALNDDRTYYEWVSVHHHHLVCVMCKTVEDVDVEAVEGLLNTLQTMIKHSSRFSQLEHSLEFFGTCKKCT